MDRTRERVDAIRITTDCARLRMVMRRERSPSVETKLQALLNRHEFLATIIEACHRQNLVGQIGVLNASMESIEDEIGIYERRLGL